MNTLFFLVVVVAPYVVIAAGMALLIYLAFRRPFPFAGLVRASLIGAAAVTALVVFSGLHGIATSRSSTAAIGYVFLPFVSVAAALVSLVVLAALLYLLRCVTDALGWSKKITSLLVALPSFLIVALACLLATLYFARERFLEQARSATTPAEITTLVEKTAKHSDWKTLALLARNPHASPETLERIYAILKTSRRPREFSVSYALAANHQTPPHILRELATLPEASIGIALATNPNTPAETVNQLAANPHWLVRNWVASNPLLTRDNLQRLTADPDKLVRENAALNLQRRGQLGGLDLSDETLLALSRRASDGDLAAIDELAELYVKARDATPQDSAARRTVSTQFLKAFQLLGENAAHDQRAWTSLKYAAAKPDIRGFGIKAYGQAAAAGSDDAMAQLVNYEKNGWLLSSVVSAMILPASENRPPAVEFLQNVLADPEAKPLWRMASIGLEGAAAKGNAAAAAAVADYKQRTASP